MRKEKILEKWNYLYDFENRLIEVKKNSITVQRNWYDGEGNRTKKTDGDKTTTYNYNGMNQLISLVENGVTTNFFYDANGNQIRKEKGIEKWYYTYDFENRLTKVEYFDGTQTAILGEYFYDGDGKRIKKVENGETTVYIYSGIQVIYEKTIETGKETKYVGRVAKIERMNGTETTTYFHMDHLGSTRGVTDVAGNLLATMTYDPFGEVRSGSSNGVRYTYTGKEQDGTGLYYYGARFYDPAIGRFITADTYLGHDFNPQSQNRYAYVLNNPIRHIDPTGHDAGYDWEEFYDQVLSGQYTLNDYGWDMYGEGLVDYVGSTSGTEDDAKLSYLMLLHTHPELEGDPTQQPEYNANLSAASGDVDYYEFSIQYGGKNSPLMIGISKSYMDSNKNWAFTSELNVNISGKMWKGYKIIIYKKAFEAGSAGLFHIIGHEGQHLFDLISTGKTSEASAYEWNLNAISIIPFPDIWGGNDQLLRQYLFSILFLRYRGGHP